ncbi:MAG: hypothetical protein IJE43_11220 [Alphaproteobacteria bacterium]|nr:hypothetical protein [Alphaproteobacteria bacterium]
MKRKKEKPEDLKKRQEAISYGYHSGKYKAEEEAQKRAKKGTYLKVTIFVIIFVLIGVAGMVGSYIMKPALDDPFAYLEVSFEGTDGRGELKMQVLNDAPDGIDMARVHFECEKDDFLSEGDRIVVEATSTDYRLGVSTKRYKVEGLECYLKDVQVLDEKQFDSIFAENETIQYGNVEMVLEDGESLQIKPLQLVCYNNKTENELFLISEVSFAISDKAYYTITEWEDVVVNNVNGNLSISYGTYWGNLTTVKSWRGAMLYEDFESAVRAVESEQSSKEEVSIRSF